MKKTYNQPTINETLTLSSEIMQTYGISAPIGIIGDPIGGDDVR